MSFIPISLGVTPNFGRSPHTRYYAVDMAPDEERWKTRERKSPLRMQLDTVPRDTETSAEAPEPFAKIRRAEAAGETTLTAPSLPPPPDIEGGGRLHVTSPPLRSVSPRTPRYCAEHWPGQKREGEDMVAAVLNGDAGAMDATQCVRAAANDSQQNQPRQKQALDRKNLSEEAQHWYDEVVVAESRLEKKDLEIAELQKSKRDLILKIDGLETDLARASSQLVEEDMEKKKTKKENDSTKLQVEQKITDNRTLKEQVASLYSSLEDEQKKTSELQKELDEANALKAALHAELDDIETNAQSMVEKKESDAEAKLKEIYDMLEEEFTHVGRGLNLDDYIKLYKEQQETRFRRDRSSTSLDSHALSDMNGVRRSRSWKRQISLGDELLQVFANGYDTDNDSLFNEKGDDTVTRSLSLEPHSDCKTQSNARLPSCTTEELDSTHDVRSMMTQNLYTSEPVEDGIMKKVDSQAWEPDPDGPLLGSSKKTEDSSKRARALSKEIEKDRYYEEVDMRLQPYLLNTNQTAAQRQHEKEKKVHDTQKLFIENNQAKEDLRAAKAEIDALKKREQKLQSKSSSAELSFSGIDSLDIRPVAVANDAAEMQSKSSSVELSLSNISSIVISPAEARAKKAERSLQELEARSLRGLRGSSPIWLRVVVLVLLLLYAYLLADVISERHLFNEVNNLTVRHMTYGSTLGQRKGWVWLMNLENYLQMDSSRPF